MPALDTSGFELHPCMTEPVEDSVVLHKPSVWDEIKSKLEPAEVPEVRAILGERLIEETELLHHETRSLVEILDEARLADLTTPARTYIRMLGFDA